MSALKSLAAVYVLLVAVAVAVHFLGTQFYAPTPGGTAVTVWRVLDPLMVLGVVIVLVYAFDRKRRLAPGQPVDREYLEANFTFYFSAMLLLLLLWNWFGVEFVEPSNAEGLVWILIDVTFPLLMASTGIRLLREASVQNG